jgi:hypothetical protein
MLGIRGNTSREAIHLYRDILRTCKHFHWTDEQKRPWSQVLKENARKEFEQSRYEEDPLVVARLLVTGRDCVMNVQNKFNAADQKIKEKILESRNRR